MMHDSRMDTTKSTTKKSLVVQSSGISGQLQLVRNSYGFINAGYKPHPVPLRRRGGIHGAVTGDSLSAKFAHTWEEGSIRKFRIVQNKPDLKDTSVIEESSTTDSSSNYRVILVSSPSPSERVREGCTPSALFNYSHV